MSLSTPQVTSSPPPLTITYFGIDFAKATFVFQSLHLGGTLPNDPAGHRRLLATLPRGAHLVCESTGSYHRALVSAAHVAGVAVTVANPRQVRDFAKVSAAAPKPIPSTRSRCSTSARWSNPKPIGLRPQRKLFSRNSS